MSQSSQVLARFFNPPKNLQHLFTHFYYVEFGGEPGRAVTDYLHPEWGNLRLFQGNPPEAYALDGTHFPATRFSITGPSSQALRFEIAPPSRMWGIGLMPLGWARYIAADAADYANLVVDALTDPDFAQFLPLAEGLFRPVADVESEYGRIAAFFSALNDRPIQDEARIAALHQALHDPEVKTVSDLVARTGCNSRKLERISHRVLGFPPKVLLRRQRLLRSLAEYILDPSLKWIGALDGHYHDQAQFVKDFREMMGMTPSQYAAIDKPILGSFMGERARFSGSPVQGLHPPGNGGDV